LKRPQGHHPLVGVGCSPVLIAGTF